LGAKMMIGSQKRLGFGIAHYDWLLIMPMGRQYMSYLALYRNANSIKWWGNSFATFAMGNSLGIKHG